jgi:hypothetical protein
VCLSGKLVYLTVAKNCAPYGVITARALLFGVERLAFSHRRHHRVSGLAIRPGIGTSVGLGYGSAQTKMRNAFVKRRMSPLGPGCVKTQTLFWSLRRYVKSANDWCVGGAEIYVGTRFSFWF